MTISNAHRIVLITVLNGLRLLTAGIPAIGQAQVHVSLRLEAVSALVLAQPTNGNSPAGSVAVERQKTAAAPGVPPLEPQVVATADRLYPGFTEILELGDSTSLARLARTLAATPSIESLTVLLWMLQACPSWDADDEPAYLQIERVMRAVGRLPLKPFARGLLNQDADQRGVAAAVLSSGASYITPGERPLYEQTLIAALSDPNIRVREFVARPLRDLRTSTADIALARAVTGKDVTDMLFWQATGRRRPLLVRAPVESSFPTETVAAVKAIAPDFLHTLATRESSSVWQLIYAIEAARNPAATPVLVWLLQHGDMPSHGGRIIARLGEPPYIERLPLVDLRESLTRVNPDNRARIADLLGTVLRTTAVPTQLRSQLIAALIDRLHDPDVEVRTSAAGALPTDAAFAEDALLRAFEGTDVPSQYADSLMRALIRVGSQRALPTLERIARSRVLRRRDTATLAFLHLMKPADAAAEVRRLWWDRPDTALEHQVLAQGRSALPHAWRALEGGSDSERRAAAVLLGWFPDAGSIPHALAGFDRPIGALTREQILFDLNMILLSEGSDVDPVQRNELAAAHLRWLYEQIATQRIDPDIRATVLGRQTIEVFPDRVVSPFSVKVAASGASATATLSESPQAFLAAVGGGESGVAFHSITAAHGIARVATTLYLPQGQVANQVWISLFRRIDNRWMPLDTSPRPLLRGILNVSNLAATINRNYGAESPLKILRLDVTMERIRVDPGAIRLLQSENRDDPRASGPLDASYVRLLERYKRSDAPAVRYAAEYESGRLTGQPNLQLWMNLLAEQTTAPFQEMALRVITSSAADQISREGTDVADSARDELVAAALTPVPIHPQLLPQVLPAIENVSRVRRSSRFGRVDVRFGGGFRGGNGYSMLFERRGDRWVFVCVMERWIS